MIDQNAVLNDPTMVPLISHSGELFVTHNTVNQDDAVIIVSSSLRARYESTQFGKKGAWLATPKRYTRGKRR